MKKLFFTADTHFWHEMAINNGLRNFKDVEEMNEKLIENWNSVVGAEDPVFHLGNFGYGTKEQNEDVLKRLNGEKHLVMGNDDWNMSELADYWLSMEHYLELEANDVKIVLSHYPMLVWHGSHKGSWMLHGTCHGGINLLNIDTLRHDVGSDNCNYTPIEFSELSKIFAERSLDRQTKRDERPLIYTV